MSTCNQQLLVYVETSGMTTATDKNKQILLRNKKILWKQRADERVSSNVKNINSSRHLCRKGKSPKGSNGDLPSRVRISRMPAILSNPTSSRYLETREQILVLKMSVSLGKSCFSVLVPVKSQLVDIFTSKPFGGSQPSIDGKKPFASFNNN